MPTEVGHDMPQLGRTDVTVSVLIKDLEGLFDLLLTISVLHLPGHHGQELREIDSAIAIGVDLVDHILEFMLCGVLAQRTHHGAKLPRGDRTVTIYHRAIRHRLWIEVSQRIVKWSLTFVEQGESLLELWGR